MMPQMLPGFAPQNGSPALAFGIGGQDGAGLMLPQAAQLWQPSAPSYSNSQIIEMVNQHEEVAAP